MNQVFLLEISDGLLALASGGKIAVNLRPNQKGTKEKGYTDSSVKIFLKELEPGSKILIHFQGLDANEVRTAAATVQSVTWTTDEYPKLCIDAGKEGIKDVWGNFILAVAKCPQDTDTFERSDPSGEIFSNLVRAFEHAEKLHVDPETSILFTRSSGKWDGDRIIAH